MYAKFCVNRETASSFMRLFVNRRAYAIQGERPLPNGSVPYYPARDWKTKEPKPLDDGVVRMHLNGDITISLYAINPETQRSKWVAIDADFDGALDSLFRLQWELKQDGVDAALEQSRRGGHLWIFGAEPLLASECRIYVYNLALRLGVPVKGGGLKEGIEVFPRQDKLDHGEFGNAIRAPLGVHRKTNRRYWFYEAEATPEGQLAYVERLTKLTETELRTFIEGMSLPEAYRPVPLAPYTPPVSSSRYPEFRILDYVRTTRKDSRNWWARCPSCAAAGHDRSGDNLAIQVKDPRFYNAGPAAQKRRLRRTRSAHPNAAMAWRESFSLLYLNPPYDSEIGSIANRRMEAVFLEHTYRWLAMEGVLILVIPFERLHDCSGILSSHFASLNVFRMTDPGFGPVPANCGAGPAARC